MRKKQDLPVEEFELPTTEEAMLFVEDALDTYNNIPYEDLNAFTIILLGVRPQDNNPLHKPYEELFQRLVDRSLAVLEAEGKVIRNGDRYRLSDDSTSKTTLKA